MELEQLSLLMHLSLENESSKIDRVQEGRLYND